MPTPKNYRLWQFTVIELDDEFYVSGTILNSKKISQGAHSTVFGNLVDILGSYFKQPAKQINLEIRSGSHNVRTKTDGKGYFAVEIAKDSSGFVEIYQDEEKLPVEQSYPWFFEQNDQPVEIISDIDDTAMVSHTASALRRVYSILFKSFRQRRAVEYSRSILQKGSEKHYRITYLSKSESNLFNLITAIFNRQELPEGALLLTPYLRLKQLPKPGKGKDYKLNHLKRLIGSQPTKKFILLGDDTQRDMEIYAEVVKLFENRIEKIFIRQTVMAPSEKQQELWKNLQHTGVDCTYFEDADPVEKELKHLKLL